MFSYGEAELLKCKSDGGESGLQGDMAVNTFLLASRSDGTEETFILRRCSYLLTLQLSLFLMRRFCILGAVLVVCM